MARAPRGAATARQSWRRRYSSALAAGCFLALGFGSGPAPAAPAEPPTDDVPPVSAPSSGDDPAEPVADGPGDVVDPAIVPGLDPSLVGVDPPSDSTDAPATDSDDGDDGDPAGDESDDTGEADPTAAPEPGSPGELTWPLDPEGEPVELTGLAPTASFRIDVPPGWELSADGALRLDYAVPQLVESAVLGIDVNGRFVDAVALDVGAGSVTIGLPADRFVAGANTVDVTATIAVLDDRACPDQGHPARVVTFAGSSTVAVALHAAAELDLADFPGALEPLGRDRRELTVRFGAEPTGEELSAAAVVLAGLRQQAELNVDIVVAELGTPDPANDRVGPELIVAMVDELVANGIEVPSGSGGVLRVDRNATDHPRLVVSGSSPGDVLAAARSLLGAPPTAILTGIEPSQPAEPPPAALDFTLADLGYPDRELSGPGVASTLYGFDAPLSHAPTSMTLTVDAVRSASGDDISGVSVLVNGSRVGTVHFDVDTGTTSGLKLNVSGDDLRPGRNFVRLETEFQGPSPSCEQLPPSESVELRSTTAIELITGEETVAIDLEDLPHLFRAPTDSVDLVVVPPADPTPQDLAAALDIAVVYGDDEYPASLARAESFESSDLDGRHVIALGEPEVQPLHDLVDDTLVDEPADDGEAGLVAPNPSLNGVIEVVMNPIDRTRAIMFATGFDAAGADLSREVLLDPELRGELYGRATFVGGDPADPVLAPVLEPVRIERGEIAVPVPDDDDRRFDTTASTDDPAAGAAPTSGDVAVFDVAPSRERSTIGGLSPQVVGLVVLLAGGLGGAGYVVSRRRRLAASKS